MKGMKSGGNKGYSAAKGRGSNKCTKVTSSGSKKVGPKKV